VAKKTVVSRPQMTAVNVEEAVVLPGQIGTRVPIEERAATALGVTLGDLARERPLWRTYKATTKDGATVALMVVSDQATLKERELFARLTERFEKEGDALPGFLRVRAVFLPGREAFLSDLWTAGSARDLAALGWGLRRRVAFVRDVVRALESLHARGHVHGCLCAANVLFDDDLRPVLAETGTVAVPALAARGADADLYVPFAAPEVAEGRDPGTTSDVFSAGKLLSMAVADDEAPHDLLVAIDRATAAEPSARFASMAELGAALDAVLPALPETEAPRSAPRPPGARASIAAPPPPATREKEPRAAQAPGAAPSTTAARRELWRPPAALGIAGVVLLVASVAAAATLGGGNEALRTVLTGALAIGGALATTLAPPVTRRPMAMRVVLAAAFVALLVVVDPLSQAYGTAAQRRLRGDAASRRAAIAEVVRLGRDFRGLSLAGLDLSGEDLAGADLRGVDLTGANLSRARLFAAEVQNANLDGANLDGADLDQVQLALAKLGDAACDGATHLPRGWRCDHARVAPAGPTSPSGSP
jgi:hypothetical protein